MPKKKRKAPSHHINRKTLTVSSVAALLALLAVAVINQKFVVVDEFASTNVLGDSTADAFIQQYYKEHNIDPNPTIDAYLQNYFYKNHPTPAIKPTITIKPNLPGTDHIYTKEYYERYHITPGAASRNYVTPTLQPDKNSDEDMSFLESASKALDEVYKQTDLGSGEIIDTTKFRTEIKPKVEDGFPKSSGSGNIQFVKDGLKVDYQLRNGQMTVHAEDKNGQDASKAQIELIQSELNNQPLRVASAGGDSLSLVSNNVAAISLYPVKIDLANHTVEVTTPQGVKTVTILPDEAVVNMVAANVIQKVDSGGDSGQSNIAQTVVLTEKNGTIAYKVDGEKTDRVLGFIPVNTKVTAYVSADTGKLVTRERSLLGTIADFLSF